MNWESVTYPPDGTTCWVAGFCGENWNVFTAERDSRASGGWTNSDTWEDFDGRVTHWIPLEKPSPPVLKT